MIIHTINKIIMIIMIILYQEGAKPDHNPWSTWLAKKCHPWTIVCKVIMMMMMMMGLHSIVVCHLKAPCCSDQAAAFSKHQPTLHQEPHPLHQVTSEIWFVPFTVTFQLTYHPLHIRPRLYQYATHIHLLWWMMVTHITMMEKTWQTFGKKMCSQIFDKFS